MAVADAVDVLLAAALVWAAWRALATRDAAGAVVLYVVFGLLAALAWVRLDAPDVALAEAAIGAGITGALLFEAVARRRRRALDVPARLPFRPLLALLAAGLAAVVGAAAFLVRGEAPGLRPVVEQRLGEAAAEHAVTSVLLDFRAYDTLLEVAVLLVAALALLALARSDDVGALAPPAAPEAQVRWVVALAAPVALLAGVYLLALGTTAPGGAFQAGAVIAAAVVLARLAGYGLEPLLRGATLRVLLGAGFAIFLLVGLATAAARTALLDYPPAWAGTLVLLVEAAVALAVAAALAVLVAGAGARRT